MPSSINYDLARNLLDKCLNELQQFTNENSLTLPNSDIQENLKTLFDSRTQSYREVALGCAVIKYFDSSVDLTLLYINLGRNSYNGRTLDEKVINPFLQANEMPASKGPYLATFRRSVKLDSTIRNSQK